MTGKAIKLGTPLAIVIALAGCIDIGGRGHQAAPRMVRLTATHTAAAGSSLSGNAAEAIIVVDPDTDRSLAVTRIAVREGNSDISYLKKVQWVERPGHLFAALLAETIRSGGKHLVFADTEAVTAAGSRLGGRLLEFGYDARGRAAVVRYDAVWRAPGGTVTTKRFEARVPNIAPKPEAIATALNQAANDVAEQVSEWLG